jgi:hypothetical protein
MPTLTISVEKTLFPILCILYPFIFLGILGLYIYLIYKFADEVENVDGNDDKTLLYMIFPYKAPEEVKSKAFHIHLISVISFLLIALTYWVSYGG